MITRTVKSSQAPNDYCLPDGATLIAASSSVIFAPFHAVPFRIIFSRGPPQQDFVAVDKKTLTVDEPGTKKSLFDILLHEHELWSTCKFEFSIPTWLQFLFLRDCKTQ